MSAAKAWSKAWVWLLAALGLAYMAGCLREPLNLLDEGYCAYCAGRMAQGAVPIRDFFTIYPPGVFYLERWAFWALGTSLATLRCFDLMLRCALALVAAWGARRAGAGAWSWLPLVLVWLFLGPMGFFGYSAIPGLLFALLATLAWASFLAQGRLAWAALAGVLAGLTAFFRQDFGMYCGLAGACGVLATIVIEPEHRSGRVKGLILFCAAAGLSLALALAQCLVEAGPAAVWSQLVLVPLSPATMDVLHLPVPAFTAPIHDLFLWLLHTGGKKELKSMLIWLALYLSLAVLAIGGLSALKDLQRGKEGRARAIHLLLFSLLGFFLLHQALNRADLPHFFPVLILSWMLLAGLLARPSLAYFTRPAALLMVLAFGGVALSEWGSLFRARPSEQASICARARGMLVPRDLDAAVAEIDKSTLPGQKIYVASNAFTGIRFENLMFYFLADRADVSPNLFGDLSGSLGGDVRAAASDPATAAMVLWKGAVWGVRTVDPAVESALISYGPPAWSSGDYEIRYPARGPRVKQPGLGAGSAGARL